MVGICYVVFVRICMIFFFGCVDWVVFFGWFNGWFLFDWCGWLKNGILNMWEVMGCVSLEI